MSFRRRGVFAFLEVVRRRRDAAPTRVAFSGKPEIVMAGTRGSVAGDIGYYITMAWEDITMAWEDITMAWEV